MYCKYCGQELNSDNKCTNPECQSNSNLNTNLNFNEFCDTNGISVSEMINFVGEKRSDYYLEKWDRYQENENFVSWNWPAFFFPVYWFWYRKIYSVMLTVLVVNILSNLILPNEISIILSLGIMIGAGMFANQLYMKYATKRILSIKHFAKIRNLNNDMLNRKLHLNGGTTIAPIIVSIVLFCIIVIFSLLCLLIPSSIIDNSLIY